MAIKYKAPKKRGDENELREAIRQPEERPSDSVFGGEQTDGAFDVQMDQGPKDIEERPGDAEAIPPRMETALQAGGGDLASVTPDRQPQLEGAPAPAEEEPQGLFEDVTDIDARQERERQAFADELAARKAEQQQQAEARAGLGGMGLSGATAELTADIGRQAERAGDIAMADLGRRQQQETFDELRRQASIWAFEEEFGVDLDGDGNEGTPPTQQERGEAPGAPDPTKGGAISIYGNNGYPLNQPPENARLIDTRLVDGTEYDIYLSTEGIEYLVNKPQSGEEAQA